MGNLSHMQGQNKVKGKLNTNGYEATMFNWVRPLNQQITNERNTYIKNNVSPYQLMK